MHAIATTRTLDLISDAGCKDGDTVQLQFDVLLLDDSPKTHPITISSNPNSTMQIEYTMKHRAFFIGYYWLNALKSGAKLAGTTIPMLAIVHG